MRQTRQVIRKHSQLYPVNAATCTEDPIPTLESSEAPTSTFQPSSLSPPQLDFGPLTHDSMLTPQANQDDLHMSQDEDEDVENFQW